MKTFLLLATLGLSLSAMADGDVPLYQQGFNDGYAAATDLCKKPETYNCAVACSIPVYEVGSSKADATRRLILSAKSWSAECGALASDPKNVTCTKVVPKPFED